MLFLEIKSIFIFYFNSNGKGSEIGSQKPALLGDLRHKITPVNVIILLLLAVGSITLIWVVNLIWQDVTVWGKDLNIIFFGSRTGENISLGMGLQVIHYYLIGISFLILATGLLLRESWNKKGLKP
jgi:hypothetical protein